MPASGPIGLIVGNSAGGDFFKCGKPGDRLAGLRKRNGSPDKGTDSGRDLHQALIKQDYLRPVDRSADGTAGVNGLNGCLQLIRSYPFERRSRQQVVFGFINYRSRPASGVLLVERYKLAVAGVACSTAGFT